MHFSNDASWGTLTLAKETRDGRIFHLTNDSTSNRSSRLEAGFIAEQFQQVYGYLTECYDEKFTKQQLITFTVKWDVKERIIQTIPTE